MSAPPDEAKCWEVSLPEFVAGDLQDEDVSGIAPEDDLALVVVVVEPPVLVLPPSLGGEVLVGAEPAGAGEVAEELEDAVVVVVVVGAFSSLSWDENKITFIRLLQFEQIALHVSKCIFFYTLIVSNILKKVVFSNAA